MICYRLPENFMEFSILYKSFFNTSFSISCTHIETSDAYSDNIITILNICLFKCNRFLLLFESESMKDMNTGFWDEEINSSSGSYGQYTVTSLQVCPSTVNVSFKVIFLITESLETFNR